AGQAVAGVVNQPIQAGRPGVLVDGGGRGGDGTGLGHVQDDRGDLAPAAERASRSPSAGLRTPAYTCWPAAASRSTAAPPIPDEHPVTRVCLRAQFMIPPYLRRRPAIRRVRPLPGRAPGAGRASR